MDPITIGLLAGAGLGMLKGQKNKQKDIDDAIERRATMLYSPWTGMRPGAKVEREDALSGVLSGGAKGAMMGSMLGKAGTPAPDEEITTGEPIDEMELKKWELLSRTA